VPEPHYLQKTELCTQMMQYAPESAKNIQNLQ